MSWDWGAFGQSAAGAFLGSAAGSYIGASAGGAGGSGSTGSSGGIWESIFGSSTPSSAATTTGATTGAATGATAGATAGAGSEVAAAATEAGKAWYKDPYIVAAGLQVTGGLLGSLLDDSQEEAERLAKERFDFEKQEAEKNRQERERQRELELQLAAIRARAEGNTKPDTIGYSNAAQRLMEGAAIEERNANNLIQGYLGALK